MNKLMQECLLDWFVEKYSVECWVKAGKELEERIKEYPFWKKIKTSKENDEWQIKRGREILKKKWEEVSKGDSK